MTINWTAIDGTTFPETIAAPEKWGSKYARKNKHPLLCWVRDVGPVIGEFYICNSRDKEGMFHGPGSGWEHPITHFCEITCPAMITEPSFDHGVC